MLNPEEIIIWFVVFLLSLTVHECAHAWVAELSGDPTARYQGRVTLNPIPHIDIFGTVIFPLVAIVSGAFMFGWAKPVPTNPLNLRDRRWGEIMIALAGPLSNVVLVILFVVLYKLIFGSLAMPSARLGDLGVPVEQLLLIGIRLNIVLAVFNMIPIPPLDGSHVLRNLLPDSLAEMYNQIPDMIGFVVLMGLIYFGITATLTAPIDHLIRGILVL